MIKAILFDLDDLMVNSAPLHIEASRRVFEPLGIDVTKMPDNVVTSYFGKRVSEIIRIIAEYFGIEENVDFEELLKRREEIFLKIVGEELEPMPGLFELVAFLKKQRYRRAVASSGTKRYINLVLSKFGLKDFFEIIVAGDMVKNGKPHPDVFLEASRRLGVKSAECIVIEDAMHGVDAAKRAGMYCIGVVNSLSTYTQDLSRADVIVNRLDEIDEELLEDINNRACREE